MDEVEAIDIELMSSYVARIYYPEREKEPGDTYDTDYAVADGLAIAFMEPDDGSIMSAAYAHFQLCNESAWIVNKEDSSLSPVIVSYP